MDKSDQHSLLMKVGDLGKVSENEARALLDEVSDDGIVSKSEAEAVFAINRQLDEAFPDWDTWFRTVLKDYLLTAEAPIGWMDEQECTWLIGQIAPSGLIGTPTSEEQVPSELRGRIKEVSTVVASKVFEFDAPNFETLVSDFLGKHLNCCHDCGTGSPLQNPLNNDLNTPVLQPVTANSSDQDEPETEVDIAPEEGDVTMIPFENPVSSFRINSPRRGESTN